MAVESVAAVAAIVEPDQFLPAIQPDAPTANFGGWFTDELSKVNDRLVGADVEIQKMAVGEPQNLHEVMIHMEEARLSFQLLVQVRNRLLEAYQEVMRMQV